MNKFQIKCPECGEVFELTTRKIMEGHPTSVYFNEMSVNSYNDHTKLECPNCGYYETDKYEEETNE